MIRALALVVLLLVATPVFAASHIQTVNNSGGNVTTISITATLTAGNAVYVDLQTTVASAWTQTAGDTLTLLANGSGGANRLYYNCSVAGGSTTFTFTFNTGAFPLIFLSEFSGSVGSCGDQNQVNTDASVTTTSTGTTATTSQANEVIYAAFNDTGADTTFSSIDNSFIVPSGTCGTPGTGGDCLASLGGERGLVAYKIVSATGAYVADLTVNDTRTFINVIGTFKVAGAGGAGACVIGGGIVVSGCP